MGRSLTAHCNTCYPSTNMIKAKHKHIRLATPTLKARRESYHVTKCREPEPFPQHENRFGKVYEPVRRTKSVARGTVSGEMLIKSFVVSLFESRGPQSNVAIPVIRKSSGNLQRSRCLR